MKRHRATAWKKYRKAKSTADTLRQQFLEERARLSEERGDLDTAQKIRLIGHQERLRESFDKIRHVLKPNGLSGILHFEIKDPDNKNEFKKISDPEEMERIMSENFKSKFYEVYDTPLARAPFIEILGLDGLTEQAEAILTGTCVLPPVIHPDIIEFIEHLKMPPEILQDEPVQTETTPSAFVSFWKKGREKIVSSMSKLHNGHYIASTLSPYLTMILAELASIPWEFGVSLARWRHSLNVALEKIQGVRLLSKLRTIHLLEADVNTGTKLIFAQRMMANAYRHRQILESQYARKYTQAIEAVLVKRLYFDYLRIYKVPGAIISNDA